MRSVKQDQTASVSVIILIICILWLFRAIWRSYMLCSVSNSYNYRKASINLLKDKYLACNPFIAKRSPIDKLNGVVLARL